MGASLSWIGVSGVSPAVALGRLGLSSGEFVNNFAVSGSVFSGQQGTNKWQVVVAKGCDSKLVSGEVVKGLSLGGEVVTCAIEEHVMYAAASCWKNGEEIWRVVHEGDKSIDHLVSQGAPPSQLPQLRQRAQEAIGNEAGEEYPVDYFFELTANLARDLVGFRHDEDCISFPREKFQLLEAAPGSVLRRKPWWALWRF